MVVSYNSCKAPDKPHHYPIHWQLIANNSETIEPSKPAWRGVAMGRRSKSTIYIFGHRKLITCLFILIRYCQVDLHIMMGVHRQSSSLLPSRSQCCRKLMCRKVDDERIRQERLEIVLKGELTIRRCLFRTIEIDFRPMECQWIVLLMETLEEANNRPLEYMVRN